MIIVRYKNLYMNVFGVTPLFFGDGTFAFELSNGYLTVSGYYKIYLATLDAIRLDSEADFHSLVSDIVSFHSLNSCVFIGDNNVGVDFESEPEPEESPAPAPVPEQEEEKKVDLSSSVVIVSCDDSQYIVFGLDVVVAYVDDCFEVVFYDDLDVRDFKYTVFSDSVYFLGGMLYINSDPALFIDSYSAFSSVDKILSKSF